MTDLPPGCGIVVVFLGKGERVPLSEPYYSLIFPVNQPLFYRFVKLCKRKFLSRKNVTFPISKNFFMLCKCHIFILELVFALFLCILHKKIYNILQLLLDYQLIFFICTFGQSFMKCSSMGEFCLFSATTYISHPG